MDMFIKDIINVFFNNVWLLCFGILALFQLFRYSLIIGLFGGEFNAFK